MAMVTLSVPEGKLTCVAVLALLFKSSKMLTFSAAPVGPLLALPPQPANKTMTATVKRVNFKGWSFQIEGSPCLALLLNGEGGLSAPQ